MMKLTPRARAFTLTELMIAVALLLVIMLGVNQVFRATSETISTAMTFQDAVRQFRGFFQIALTDFVGINTSDPNDITGIVEQRNLPFLAIRSEQIQGQLNSNTPPSDFRVDTLAFFSRGEFKRRTGMRLRNRELFVADQVSDQAFIWYGHLMLPNNNPNPSVTGDYFGPGWDNPNANPNNFYAQNWRLGRMAILLLDRPEGLPPTNFVDSYRNISYSFLGRPPNVTNNQRLWPLSYGAWAYTTDLRNNDDPYQSDGVQAEIQYSWVDVAATTIGEGYPAPKGYWQIVQEAQAQSPNNWWQPLVNASGTQDAFRFYANPFVRKPLNRDAPSGSPAWQQMAMTVPPVLNGCTDFIVEFAGDYDGQHGIDTWTPRGSQVSQIRWYGAPRDSDGDGVDDVEPVSAQGGGRRPFERELPSGNNGRYICVWGPAEMTLDQGPFGEKTRAPMLIRITARLVDVNGRMGSGLTQEYIFKVRHD